MSYTPPTGESIEFDLTGTYSAPLGDHIEFDLGESGPAPLPLGIGGGYRLPWGLMARKNRASELPWGEIKRSDGPLLDVTWNDMDQIRRLTDLPWAGLDRQRKDWDLPWAGLDRLGAEQTRLSWRSHPAKNSADRLPWNAGQLRVSDVVAPFGPGEAMTSLYRLPWAALAMIRSSWADAWIALTAQNVRRTVLWGRKYYEEICLRQYLVVPGDLIEFNIHQPIEATYDKDEIIFRMESLSYDLRCGHREPSGRRDKYIIPPAIPQPIILPVFILMDTILVKRISDDLPIEMYDVSISGDLSSWCWSFSGTVDSRQTLEAVWPRGVASPVEIEANINGWVFQFAVEGYGEDLRFPSGTWRITGRSRSVTLADPYGATRSFVSSADRQAVQLAGDELQYTGWTIDWTNAVNWLVGAGSFSYQDKTKLAAIQQLAAAIGARVMTHRYNSELIVVPRYATSPWDWSGATPAMEITPAVMDTLARDWDRRSPLNRVFVSGADSHGVRVRVTRDGTAGDLVAPMVTDPLITHVDAGRERGRQVLSAAGNWERVRFATFLRPDPELPGLIMPGTLLQVVETGDTWIGQTTGVTISVSSQDGAVVVGQTVAMERAVDG